MELNLQYFTGHSVTVYSDAGFSAASASPNSSVDKNTEVTLTLTLDTGYEIDEVECVSGGVTVNLTTKKFAMGEADVVLFAKSKANNKYKVTETTVVNINGTKTTLARNLKLVTSASGAIVDVETTGTAVTLDAGTVAELVKAGILVKI